jgi:glutaminyl-tRNA synthetase
VPSQPHQYEFARLNLTYTVLSKRVLTELVRGGNAPDGRKVQGTIHWVGAADAVTAEVRLYNQLFAKPDPDVSNFAAELNPNSLEVLTDAKVEPALAGGNDPAPVQFERMGYFARDNDSAPGRPVFNRTVGLRDTWGKVQAGG